MLMSKEAYLAETARTRARRMKWWHDARFGMFIHWGLYSQLGRHEWVMNRERIPIAEYEKLAQTWKPKPRPAREWAALAKAAGMKYMVMTTKHHEGFCLWDTKLHDYNAAKQGPGRDLVREYVEACREFGLRIGFYYSLMDWHHPDGARCAYDEAARKRFVTFTREAVRELMTNYGKIDILWYDVAWPLGSPDAWESWETNQMVRKLQPHIIINNRSQLEEDFGTPEEHIQAAEKGRAWEACMTFNGSWGWQYAPPEDWHSVRKVIEMLRTCTAGGGNLLLNVGPKPDGSLPEEAVERLTKVGQWLEVYGKIAVYGKVDRVEGMEWMPTGSWTRRGKTYYFWSGRWAGSDLAIGGITGRLASARVVPGGKPLPFEQTENRLVIHGLPPTCPDRIAQIGLIEMKFKEIPTQRLGAGYVLLEQEKATPLAPCSKWCSPFLASWLMSHPMLKGDKGIAGAPYVGLAKAVNWQPISADAKGFVDVHARLQSLDAVVYLANKFVVSRAGTWTLQLGHDGGVRVFVDGKSVFCDPKRRNPATPGRSLIALPLKKGTHEIVVALDTDKGWGWGIYANFAIPEAARKPGTKPTFPKLAK